MIDYLKPDLSEESKSMSVLGLAHIGDAVFELMVRTWLCMRGVSTSKRLHSETISYVSARAQSEAAARILPALTGEELAVFKRGRNAHVNAIPQSSSYEEYHTATGIEALFGYLYLRGETARAGELFEEIVSDSGNA